MTVRDYSTTANDNTTIEGIALADTMLANALDNAIRQAMADSANLLLDIAKPTATTGSANAYILTTGGTVDAYVDKVRLAIRPNFSNTGACTINVDTVGVVDLKIYTSSGVGNPASGQIQSGGIYDILYVDALGDFVVLNPTPSASELVGDTTPQLGGPLDTNSFQVKWSKGADVASASALTLGADGNIFDVTGTTAITSIGTLGVGTTVMLRATASLPLTHHATNLILLGAVSVTLAAGDWVIFTEHTVGKWTMVSANFPIASFTDATTGTQNTKYMTALRTSQAIDALGFSGSNSYESSGQTITSAGLLTLAHGLGIRPKLITGYLKNTSAELGYSVGDEVEFSIIVNSTSTANIVNSMYADSTNVFVRFSNAAWAFHLANKSTGASVIIANSKWDLYVRAWA